MFVAVLEYATASLILNLWSFANPPGGMIAWYSLSDGDDHGFSK